MIKVRIGDLFESRSQTLINTVNCMGVMGKGIALHFKQRYPDMFKDYVDRCKQGKVQLGIPYLFKPKISHFDLDLFQQASSINKPWILNFPTKDHWRSPAKLDKIVQGLEYLIAHYKQWGIRSLAVPPLGCGEGGLEWRIVGPTLHRYLKQLEIPVELYAPFNTPHCELNPTFLDQSMDPINEPPSRVPAAIVALVEILYRRKQLPYAKHVGRTIWQKEAHAATLKGIPTGLHFIKGTYGPFSRDLKRIETQLINNGMIVQKTLEKMIAFDIGPAYEDARHAYKDQLEQWSPKIDNVVDLFRRLDSSQTEVVSTILFALDDIRQSHCQEITEQMILNYVLEWKGDRDQRWEQEKIGSLIRSLGFLNWINITISPDLPMLPEDRLDP